MHRKNTLKHIIASLSASLLAGGLAIAAACCLARTTTSSDNPKTADRRMTEDLARLSEETYEAVFFSMHATEYFREDDFAYYVGPDTVVGAHSIRNTQELSQYLNLVFSSGNAVTNIFLCLDPALLWTSSGQVEPIWNRNLQDSLFHYISKYPEVTFSVLISYPYIDYWLSLDEDELASVLALYSTLACDLDLYPNTIVFFPGYEPWLTVNPDNYEGTMFDANETITLKLILYTFCNQVYQITSINEDLFWDSFLEAVTREKNTPTHYPDLSDWQIIFFGDSVLANYESSYSIPGYINGLSNASTYNFAAGGTSAVHGFPAALYNFQTSEFPSGGRKTCFLINYGFNDYFNGHYIENPLNPYDETSFTGSLRVHIAKLQELYSDAHYILMTPTHTSLFENGNEIRSEQGGPLRSYVSAEQALARDMGIHFLDNYNDFVITADNLTEYLEDDCHPNENGRLAIARRIMDLISTF